MTTCGEIEFIALDSTRNLELNPYGVWILEGRDRDRNRKGEGLRERKGRGRWGGMIKDRDGGGLCGEKR